MSDLRAVPSSLRRLNQRRLLEELLLLGGASRAELADRAGMSRPTAGKIIDELLEAGVLEEHASDDPPPPGRLGRPGRTVALERQTPRVILVQLGVQRTHLAAVPLGAPSEVQWSLSFATPRSEATFLRRLRQARSELPAPEPWVFALSVPGVYDERKGRARLSPNLHWIEGLPLVARIAAEWGLPGCGVQEIRALALGHQSFERSNQDFLLVDADDGVGAAALVGGQLLEGPLASSGELGHSAVLGNQRACGCGGVGCLETLVSRAGLLASYAQAAKKSAPSWSDFLGAVGRQSQMPAWLADTLLACAITVGGALNMLGLDRVVLTGLFEELPTHAVAHLMEQIERSSLSARFGRVQIRVAPRNRAQGLLRRAFDHLLIPTEDWRRPGVVAQAPML